MLNAIKVSPHFNLREFQPACAGHGRQVQGPELLRRRGQSRFGAAGEVGATPCSFGENGGLRRFGVIGHSSEGFASCHGQVLVPGFSFCY